MAINRKRPYYTEDDEREDLYADNEETNDDEYWPDVDHMNEEEPDEDGYVGNDLHKEGIRVYRNVSANGTDPDYEDEDDGVYEDEEDDDGNDFFSDSEDGEGADDEDYDDENEYDPFFSDEDDSPRGNVDKPFSGRSIFDLDDDFYTRSRRKKKSFDDEDVD
jgi:hypothetical protein